MRIAELEKGDWVINFKMPGARPWYVCNPNYNGMTIIRRGPKIGKITLLMPGQLRAFQKYELRQEQKKG
jgi:hypothetical protein